MRTASLSRTYVLGREASSPTVHYFLAADEHDRVRDVTDWTDKPAGTVGSEVALGRALSVQQTERLSAIFSSVTTGTPKRSPHRARAPGAPALAPAVGFTGACPATAPCRGRGKVAPAPVCRRRPGGGQQPRVRPRYLPPGRHAAGLPARPIRDGEHAAKAKAKQQTLAGLDKPHRIGPDIMARLRAEVDRGRPHLSLSCRHTATGNPATGWSTKVS
jgi:hypothetical protein